MGFLTLPLVSGTLPFAGDGLTPFTILDSPSLVSSRVLASETLSLSGAGYESFFFFASTSVILLPRPPAFNLSLRHAAIGSVSGSASLSNSAP